MKSKHTPGPWTSERMLLPPKTKDRRSGFVVNGPDTSGEPLPVRVCDLRVPVGIDGFSEGRANATLIASSPDLLSALQNLVGAITIQSPNLDKNIADAYAAIKKATE